MKKIVVTFSLILCGALTFAQQDSVNTIKGQEGDWGISFNISGIINNIKLENDKDVNGNYLISARKYLKDDVALRLGLSINSMSSKWNQEDSITISSGNRALQVIDSTQKRFDFSVFAGYEKHLKGTLRLDPYIGAGMMIGRIGNTKIDVNTDVTDVTGTDKTQHILQYDGGFAFGLGGFAGFNYFVAQKLSLGAEFGLMYNYSKTGGDWSESIVNTPVSGSQSTVFNLGKQSQSESKIAVNSTASILLSYFF